MNARHAFVTGRVQGVAFRYHARCEARSLGLAGWVRNLVDGRVEVWFEGAEESVATLERWLARGPTGARVEQLDVEHAAACDCTGFEIL